MQLYMDSLRLAVPTSSRLALVTLVCAVVFPVLLVASVPVGALVLLFLQLPLLGLLIVFVVAAALFAAINGGLIVGSILSALSARGYDIRFQIRQLLRFIVISSIVTFIAFFVAGLFSKAIMLVSGYIVGSVDGHILLHGFRDGSAFAYGVLLLILAPYAVCLGALVVPFTAMVAQGCTRMADHDVTFGFGKGIVGLSVLALVCLYAGALALASGSFGLSVDVTPVLMVEVFVLIALASWFFASAVLIWEQAVLEKEDAHEMQAEAIRLRRIDPRALRIARQSKNPEL